MLRPLTRYCSEISSFPFQGSSLFELKICKLLTVFVNVNEVLMLHISSFPSLPPQLLTQPEHMGRRAFFLTAPSGHSTSPHNRTCKTRQTASRGVCLMLCLAQKTHTRTKKVVDLKLSQFGSATQSNELAKGQRNVARSTLR